MNGHMAPCPRFLKRHTGLVCQCVEFKPIPPPQTFGYKVHEAFSRHLEAGNRSPKFLYLGHHERNELIFATKTFDAKYLGKPSTYCGLQIVRVSEPSFFQVG